MLQKEFKNTNLNVGSLDRIHGIGNGTIAKIVQNGYSESTPVRSIDWRKMSDISGIGAEKLSKIYGSVGVKVNVNDIKKYQGKKMQKSQTKIRIAPSERGFSFSELNDDAKDVAMKEYNLGEYYEGDWQLDSDYVSECFADRLRNEGLPYEDIRFSLSHSQGDGVAFYGTIDFEELFTKNPDLMEDMPELHKLMNMYNAIEDKSYDYKFHELFDGSIESNSNHYVHANTMYLNVEIPDMYSMAEAIDDEIDSNNEDENAENSDVFQDGIISEEDIESELREFENYFEDFIKGISNELEDEGYEEFDFKYTEEYAKLYFDDLDYRFSKEGKTIHSEW